MKRKGRPQLDLETITPLLIQQWRRMTKLSGPTDRLQTREFRRVVASLQELRKAMEENPKLLPDNALDNTDLLGAYLLYYWPLHYQEAFSLLNELPRPPRRVLDLCSGPAPMAFAALKHGAGEVIARDLSEYALKTGAEVCGRYGYPLTIQPSDAKHLHQIEGKYDLIIVGHALENLFPNGGQQEARLEWVSSLKEFLTDDGYLLIVDSSLPPQNMKLLQIRDHLVSEGFPVQAPCVWKGNCPARENKTVCYAQREMVKTELMAHLQRAANINLSSLKMSYLIVRSPKAEWPLLPQQDLYRVISPPVEVHHGQRYHLCGTDGKKTLESTQPKLPPGAKPFQFLKRGDLISISDGLKCAKGYTITDDTVICVEAACGKPID